MANPGGTFGNIHIYATILEGASIGAAGGSPPRGTPRSPQGGAEENQQVKDPPGGENLMKEVVKEMTVMTRLAGVANKFLSFLDVGGGDKAPNLFNSISKSLFGISAGQAGVMAVLTQMLRNSHIVAALTKATSSILGATFDTLLAPFIPMLVTFLRILVPLLMLIAKILSKFFDPLASLFKGSGKSGLLESYERGMVTANEEMQKHLGQELPAVFSKGWRRNLLQGFSALPGSLSGPGIQIKGMATGGIVNSPTLAMIGEAGPEAVVPLSKGGGMDAISAWAAIFQLAHKNANIWEDIKIKAIDVWDDIGIKANDIWDGLLSKGGGFLSSIQEGLVGVTNTVKENWNEVKEKANQVWNSVQTDVVKAWTGITDKVGDSWTDTQDMASNLLGSAKETVGNIVNSIGDSWTDTKDMASNFLGSAKETMGNIFNSIGDSWTDTQDMASNLWGSAKETMGNIINPIKDKIITATNAVDSWWENSSNIWNTGKQSVGNIVGIAAFDSPIKEKVSEIVGDIGNFIKQSWPFNNSSLKPTGISSVIPGLEARTSEKTINTYNNVNVNLTTTSPITDANLFQLQSLINFSLSDPHFLASTDDNA